MATAYQTEEAPSAAAMEDRVLDAARGITHRLSALASEQVSRKLLIEERWLEDLRAYFGHYEPVLLAKLNAGDKSTAFVKVTRAKTDAWAARISDMLFPTDDRNWGIKPTPLPKLAAAAKDAVAEARKAVDAANQQAAAGNDQQAQMTIAQADAFSQAVKQTNAGIDEAKKRCDRMQEAIDDQLVQARWIANARDAIEDGCRIGTGILKGPITSQKMRQEWRVGQDGKWALAQLPDPQPTSIRVDPWHFFPDMSARNIADAEFTFERSLPTKKDLRLYARKLGFNKRATARLLENGPGVTPANDTAHIVQLRTINGEGDAIKDRYVMWEYHGPLECDEIACLLRAAGREDDANRFEEEKDPFKDYRVVLHFCDGEVLRIAEEWALDSGEGLYSVWNFCKGETSVFGLGVPRIMNHSQKSLNGAWRMMMDNSGLSVGPQIVMEKESVTPQDGTFDLRPLKIWLKTSTSLTSAQNPPFQVYNIPNNQQQLQGIIELAKMFIDEETSMPLIAQGEMGAQVQPVGTTSMMFNSANVVFRRIIKGWDDDITTPTIGRFYQWNMQFNPQDDIKGDMQVDARGTSVLLVKEMQSQNLLMIMNSWTVHPVLKHFIKVREGLEKTVQTMMIPPDDILEEADVAQQKMDAEAQAAAQAAQQGPDPSMQIRKEIAEGNDATRLQIAQLQRDTKVMELSQAQGVSIAKINADLEKSRQKLESTERTKAVEIAVEDQRAERARTEGQDSSAGTGKGIG
jgi:hypothetical protein